MSLFSVKKKDGMYGLFLNKGPYYTGDVIYTLSGTISENPTQTSIKVSDYNHIEDDWGKYINHNCQPSVQVREFELVALRDLRSGDEVTFNYLKNEDELVVPFFCKCCNKLIS